MLNPRIIIFTISIIGYVSYYIYFKPKEEQNIVNDDIEDIRQFEKYNKHMIDKLIENIVNIKNEKNSNIENIVQLQIDIRKQIDEFKLYLPASDDLLIQKWDIIAKNTIRDIQESVKIHRSL